MRSLADWWDDTHGKPFELTRHFLARMLDGEWSSTPGQWQSVVIGGFAAVMPTYVALMTNGSRRQVGQSPSAQVLSLLTLMFAVTGLVALIQWQNLFPGRRDYLALAGFPVRVSQVFLARFGAVVVFSASLAVAMNLLPALIAPRKVAQFLAGTLGCWFVLLSVAALQGLMLNLLPAKIFARLSPIVQGLLMGALVLAGLLSWTIRELPAGAPGEWAPPVWFAGLRARLAGGASPFDAAMAVRALEAWAGAAILTAVCYLVSFRRYRRLLVEAPVQVAVPGRWRWSFSGLLGWSRRPRFGAAFQFMVKTLARSRAHRVIWLAYIGGAVGVMLNSSLIDGHLFGRSRDLFKGLRFIVLFWPLGISITMLCGFRHVLSIPAELAANWIFRLNESHGREAWMKAVERLVILYAIAPVYLAVTPLAIYLLGLPLALRMTTLQLLTSLTFFEFLFYSWQQFPFTCAYIPGKRPLVAIIGMYFALLALVVPILSVIIRAGSDFGGLFVIYGPIFAGVWFWARLRRLEGWGESVLVYEDPGDSMPQLGIRELAWPRHAKEMS